MSEKIIPLLLPKWGMDMDEGKIGEWLVAEGDPITDDTDILEVESDKITNVLHIPGGGVLRLQIAEPGEMYPVGALLGVIVSGEVSEDEILKFVASYKADDFVPDVQEAAVIPQVDEMIDVNAQKLHYTSVGDGNETVVLIHGFGGDLSSWGNLPMALATTYRVISVELPGHGLSSKQIEAGGSEDFAHLLLAFFGKLDIGNVHLVGHSLGGAIASQIALHTPMRVKSLTLVSNYGLGTKVDLGFLSDFVAVAKRKDAKAVLKRLFFKDNIVNSEMIENILKLKRIEGVNQALGVIAEAVRAEQPVERGLLMPPVPTQVIVGREDTIIAFDNTLLSGIDNIAIIDDAGHMPQLEKPAQTEALIKDFLGKDQEYQSL